jgi:hypothetical protein
MLLTEKTPYKQLRAITSVTALATTNTFPLLGADCSFSAAL